VICTYITSNIDEIPQWDHINLYMLLSCSFEHWVFVSTVIGSNWYSKGHSKWLVYSLKTKRYYLLACTVFFDPAIYVHNVIFQFGMQNLGTCTDQNSVLWYLLSGRLWLLNNKLRDLVYILHFICADNEGVSSCGWQLC
jgi:hypothetical protein